MIYFVACARDGSMVEFARAGHLSGLVAANESDRHQLHFRKPGGEWKPKRSGHGARAALASIEAAPDADTAFERLTGRTVPVDPRVRGKRRRA